MSKLILTILLLASTTAQAALSGSVVLSGTVPAATSILVTPQTGYNTLDLTTTAVNLLVANVTEMNNTVNGYTVTMSSANAGLLKNGTLGSVPYTAKYNGVSAALTVAPVTVTTQGPQSTVVNVVKSFTINYTGTPSTSHMAGAYTDTLTFIITAN